MKEIFVALPFLQFGVSLFLASVVIFSDPKDRLNRIFALFLVAMSLWGLTIFGMRDAPLVPPYERAHAWENVALAVIPFASILFYHFVYLYARPNRGPTLVWSFYALGIVSAVLSLAGFSATGMSEKFYGLAPEFGWGFAMVLLASYPPVAMAIYDLTKARQREQQAAERSRLSMLRLGLIILVIGGTSDILPSLGLTIYPMGILGNLLFAIITTWAFTRHRLMNLRLVLRRGLAYTTVSSLIFATYGLCFGLVWLFAQNLSVTGSVIAAVGAVLLVSVFVQPVLGRVQTFVDRLFFRERYDHLVALVRLNEKARDISDFPALANSLIVTVTKAMQCDWAAIVLPDRSAEYMVPMADSRTDPPELQLDRTGIIGSWLSHHKKPLRGSDLDADPFLQAMSDTDRATIEAFGAELMIPMVAKGSLTGILMLGPKLVGADYSVEDLSFLTTTADQAAMAVENARMYAVERERLDELERLDSLKSNLLMTVSHELKSPLTAIKVATDLLGNPNAAGAAGAVKSERLIRTLKSGVSRLERLTQESLDYAAMQSAQLKLHPTSISLKEVVDESAGLFASSIRSRQQTFTLKVDDSIGTTWADPARIERIVTNLISNAHKFTPVGGSISARIFEHGEHHVIEVSDTGEGIPEDELELVFSPYYRSKNADGRQAAGTGLGLSIARYLANLHGGQLEVSSKIGEGTVFTLRIPGVRPDRIEEIDDTPPDFEFEPIARGSGVSNGGVAKEAAGGTAAPPKKRVKSLPGDPFQVVNGRS